MVTRSAFPTLVALVASLLAPVLAQLPPPASDPITYCSSQNTGANFNEQVSLFQSNGNCSGTCTDFAFAILQDKTCWCANFAPAITTDTSDCSDPCPGYPPDKCGNLQKNLFAYILLNNAPSGTLSRSSAAPSSSSSLETSSSPSSASSSSSSSSSASSSSQTSSSSSSSSTSSTSSSISSSSASPSSSSSSSTSSSSSGQTTPAQGSTSSSSQGGSSSTSADAAASSASNGHATAQKSSGKSFFDDKGKVAGVFVVVALAILAIILGIIYLLYRRANRSEDVIEGSKGSPSSSSGSPRAGGGMLRRDETATTLAVNQFDEKSAAMPIVDQRLDPGRMYFQWHESDSRRSLHDELDYSRRVLRVANPDRFRDSMDLEKDH